MNSSEATDSEETDISHGASDAQDAAAARARRIAALPEHARGLLRARLAGQTPAARPQDTVTRADTDGPLPLSPAQERLWYLHELEPESIEYNTLKALRVTGGLNADALSGALDAVVARHGALRTVFGSADGRAEQTVRPAGPVPLPRHDLSDLPAGARDAVLLDLLRQEAARTFDLRHGPVLRASLVRLSAHEHVLILSAHHIVTDGWSMGVLVRELTAGYAALLRGGTAELSEPPVRYVDFAAWQRTRLDSGQVRDQLEYWRRELAGLEPLDLPTTHPRPPVRSGAGAACSFAVPDPVAEELRRLARENGATLFMTLVAAVQVLLGRWTGRHDLAVGTAAAGRGRVETEQLIGFFVNNLVLRSRIDEDRPFGDLLRAVRSTVLDAFAHEEAPFQRVVEVLRPERDPGRPPLAEVAVNLHNTPPVPAEMSGLLFGEVPPPVLTSSMDLSFDFIEDGGRLTGQLTYNTDLFDARTAERITGHLLTLLQDLAARPLTPVGGLAVLGPDEHRLLTEKWAATGPGAEPRTVPELFAAWVARTPAADALVSDEGTLSYRELDELSNRWARLLLARGAGPERIVAVALPRSALLVVAILAIQKTGAAYMPLDPRSPAERNRLMLEDAGPLLVLTSAGFGSGAGTAPPGATASAPGPAPAVPVLCADDPPVLAEVAALPGTALTSGELPGPLLPAHPAYVIYTSGSTGRPKGVVVSHTGVHGLVAAQSAHFGTGPGARVLLFAAVGFDAGFSELGMALLAGGALVVAAQDRILPGDPLATVLIEHRVTHVTLPPGALSALRPGALPRALTLVVAGEVCPPDVARAWSAHHRMINAYGPTESTVCASMSEVLAPRTISGGPVPIGRPLDGVAVRLLDARLRPVPVGVPGEIHLSGEALARGYLGRFALTAERFVADPYGPAGSRMYRTGDRARWLEGGVLEYLGRGDDQVKLRGFRIELGEVEAVLARHDAVAAVAATVHRDDLGNRRLVAHVVPADADLAAVRAYARDHLPEHMVPAAFVLLDRLPLNTNGKVDRAALPAPDLRRGQESPRVAPRSPAEEVLARIWSEVLGVDDIGVEDNFFDLGGDSILSLQVVARAQAAGLPLTAKQTFLRQTVAALAAEAEAAAVPDRHGTDDPDRRLPVTGDVPATPIQHWFFEHLQASLNRFNQSMFLKLGEAPDQAALRTALLALTARHDVLRLRAVHEEKGWRLYQTEAETGELLASLDLSASDASAQDALMERAVAEAQQGFRLAEGPLLRARLFDLGPNRAPRLYLVAHHLVVDAMSWRILLEDLEDAYRQARSGGPVDLGPKSTSFRDWSLRLSRYVADGGLDDELEYWRGVHESAAAAVPVPVDAVADSGDNTAGSLRTVSVRLSAETTDALLRRVPGAYRTQVNDVLLSALGRVLTDWSGGDRALIALEGHGRETLFDDVDLSRTVGWFTTLFPVVLRMPADRGWGPVLKSVKEQLRAVPRHGLGHGALRYLRDEAHAPLRGPEPEVGFNYLGRLDVPLRGTGLTRALLPVRGQERAADQQRQQLIEINGAVTGGRLEFHWSYSAHRHSPESIERLAAAHLAALTEIVAHCEAPGAGGVTPSDFPLVALDQAALDRVVGDGRTVEDLYPLTPAQSGMLFHALGEDGRDPYTGHFGVRIDGVTRPEELARAWQTVVDRTPALRTSMIWQGVPEPLQVVHATARVPVVHHDLRALPEHEREFALVELWDRRQETVIDLATAPPLRVTLVRLSDSAVQMFWTSHHILMDGWSFASVLSEVCARYAELTGGPKEAAPARRPYRDYVAWLAGQDQEAAREYWRSVLGGFGVPTPLPYDRPPVKAHTTRSSREVRTRLTGERHRRLVRCAREARLTVSTLVQGAWALLLARYGGEQEVCFGSTVSGRPATLPGAESMIGLFINTVPVRVRVYGTEPVTAWLRALQTEQLDSRPYEHVSLARIQRYSDVPAGGRLFDSIVVFENYPYDKGAAARHGLEIGTFQGDEVTDFALTLTAYATDELHLVLGYDPALFDEATAERMTRHLATLLDAMAAGPDTAVDDLPLMDDAERERLLHDWNATDAVFPEARPVHELFAEQAARTPDAVAVRCEADELTFRDLDVRANQLAHHLGTLGVRPGTLVGVCAERGTGAIVALLGVLRAGGAFVPLDPAYPAERLLVMLDDAAVPVVITEEALLDRTAGHDAVAVCLDRDRALLDALPYEAPDTSVTPEDLAYVVYTSGTTGRPKGVMVEHRHVHHMVHAWDRRYGLTALRPSALSVSSLSVDLFFGDFLLSSLFGGTMVICPQDAVADQVALADLLLSSRARLMVTVPSLARALVAELSWRGVRPDDLRVLMVGSEGWPADAAAEILAGLAPGTVLVNAYGSTETTVDSTVFALGAEPLGDSAHVPVGRPLANTRIYVLDAARRPVPTGVVGECYIGGDGVSRGYLNRPELTAERFLDDPFVPGGGARMYRTGDLVRWRADGNLQCLGRVDDQVKIRGFRVELGEVEAATARHPSVAAAAAAVRSDDDGPARLVGYVVPAPGATPDFGALRAFVAERLPAPAVPTSWMTLDALPMTPSGTVNRRALPAPPAAQDPAVPYAPPRDPVELLLTDMWQEVLGVRRVGVHDNFFDLGGDSILSIRVISRIRAALGTAPSPRQLFDTPTVASLAAALGAQDPGDVADVPLTPVARTGRLPLSFAQQRQWFLNDFAPESSEYHIVTGLRLTGEPDVPALRAALDALVARHEALRTTYADNDGVPYQVVRPAQPVPLLRTDLSGAGPADGTCAGAADGRQDALRAHVALAAARPFDLAHGPVLRAELIRCGGDAHLLLLVVHHIATDGVSMGILLDELGVHYAAALDGTTAALPPLPVGYPDYAVWQRRTLADARGEVHLAYWRKQLAGIRPLELPTDRPRPPVRSSAGSMLLLDLDPAVSAGLRDLARRHDATLFMVLTAAVQVLLARRTGRPDVVVGTPVSGRVRQELEGVVGLFVNTVALRSDVDERLSLGAFLAEVRDTVLEAFVHEEVPFDRLVEELQSPRDPSRNAVVEVFVGLEGQLSDGPALPGLEVTEVPFVSGEVSHDLSFDFADRSDALQLAVGYSTALFDARTVEGMAEELCALLAGFPDGELLPLAEIAPPDAQEAGRRAALRRTAQDSAQDPSADIAVRAAHVAPRTATERTVADIWADVLAVRRVGADDEFFALGGDSLLSIQTVQRLRRAGLQVTTKDLFVHQSVAALAALAEQRAALPAPDDAPATQEGRDEPGDVPLTPAQHDYFAAEPVVPGHFAQSVFLALHDAPEESALRTALSALVARHDALRHRFVREGSSWRQYTTAPARSDVLRTHDLSGVAEPDRAAAVDRLVAEAEAGFALDRGPLLAALLFDFGPEERPRLFLTAHHLVVDGVSWRILLDDLDRAYARAVRGEPGEPGERTTSFARWASLLARHVAQGRLDDEAAYWLALPQGSTPPVDLDGPAVAGSVRGVTVDLEEDATEALLRRSAVVFRTRFHEVLYAALAHTLARWTATPRVVFDTEGHGREETLFDDVDLSRTVGWFTSQYPVALDVPEVHDDWAALVRSVRRQLRALPANGFGFGALRRLSAPGAPGAALAERPPSPVVFNYHGQADDAARSDDAVLRHTLLDPVGREQHPDERVPHLLEVVGSVHEGRLRFIWYYSRDVHHRATVEKVAADFTGTLRSLARHVKES